MMMMMTMMVMMCMVRDVDHRSEGQPVFVPAELENVTVVEGQVATLLCRVYGDGSTHLQVCHLIRCCRVVVLFSVLLFLW